MTKLTKLWGALALIFAAATTWGVDYSWSGSMTTTAAQVFPGLTLSDLDSKINAGWVLTGTLGGNSMSGTSYFTQVVPVTTTGETRVYQFQLNNYNHNDDRHMKYANIEFTEQDGNIYAKQSAQGYRQNNGLEALGTVATQSSGNIGINGYNVKSLMLAEPVARTVTGDISWEEAFNGKPLELTVSGNAALTISAAKTLAKLTVKGTGNLTLAGTALLTTPLIDASAHTGTLTLNVSNPVDMKTTVFYGKGSLVYNNDSNDCGQNEYFLQIKSVVSSGQSGPFTKGGLGANTMMSLLRPSAITVAGGTLRRPAGNNENAPEWNISNGNLVVTVKNGATFDINGGYNKFIKYVLEEGAKLSKSKSGGGNTNTSIAGITLNGNATLDFAQADYWVNSGYGNVVVALGDYTLTKSGAGELHLNNVQFTGNGTLEVNNGTVKLIRSAENGGAACSVAGTLYLNGGTIDLNGKTNFSTKNLKLASAKTVGNGTMTVNGEIDLSALSSTTAETAILTGGSAANLTLGANTTYNFPSGDQKTFKLCNGTLSASTAPTGVCTVSIAGVQQNVTLSYDTDAKTVSYEAAPTGIAKVGDLYFETLEAAIDAALGRPITLLANATGPAGCYLINANGHTFSVGAGLSEVHWTRTDGIMYKVTTTADATVGQKRVESNKYDKVTAFSGANPVVVNSLFIPVTDAMPKGSKVTIQSIGLSYRETGCPNSITLAGITSSSMANTGSDTIRVGENNGSVKWVRYAFDDVEVTVGEEIAITDGSFNAQFTSVAETDTTALRKTAFKDSQSLIYEIQYTVTKIASPDVVTVTINGVTTGYATIDEAIEAAANATTAEVRPVITLAEGQTVPAGFIMDEETRVLTAAKYIVISPSSYVSNWKEYVAARAESPVADGITFGVKNANEIYDSYPADAGATDGTPRNDAESIHKWIGLMQKLGTKYFVLGGRWVDVAKGAYDRTTLIPGIAVYPKAKKPTGFNLDTISSDLYYACHYAEEGKYVWDPSGDGVYLGLFETNPDQIEDVRHFQPNCVVSRMNFYPGSDGSRTYQSCIADYTAKLARVENAETFGGTDRYVIWASRCEKDVGGKPDCYPAQKARADYIPTVRAVKEMYFNYLPDTATAEEFAAVRAEVLAKDWELMLPVEHGTADGLGNLNNYQMDEVNHFIKFMMANVPCMTGQVSASGCWADQMLSRAEGGTVVSINNTSYGYASTSGMAGRMCGVSDEIVDWCLNSYVGGSTAGEAWRYAIAQYAQNVLSTTGFKDGVLAARGHEGPDSTGVDSKVYVIAAMTEEMLFGDPLVKIQSEKGASQIATTVEHTSITKSLSAAEFDAALTDFAKTDAKSMTVIKSCGNAETAIAVPAGKTLAVDNATLTASTITVDGTFVGAGTVNANFVFGENATLDTSRLTKLTIGSGAITSYPQDGINFIVPEGTTQIPAVLSLLVANSPSETAFHAAVKSITAKGSDTPLTPSTVGTPFKLESYNGKVYLVDEGNVIQVSHELTSLNAIVDVIYIEDAAGVKTVVEQARHPETHQQLGYYLVPGGSKIIITVQPDAEHTGNKQTATITNVDDISKILSGFTAYEESRTASTVFYNAGEGVVYTGAMANKVVNSEGHNSQILDDDTVVFDGDHEVPAEIVVGADPKGAKLVFEKDVTLTTTQAATLFADKDFEIHADRKLTFKPGTADGFKLGNCTMNKGTAVFAANGDKNVFYLDSIVGTTLLDFRPEVEIRSLNDDDWIHFHTRVTGGATVTGNVRILGDARVLVKGSEYIKVTGDVTAQVVDAEGRPVAGEYHRLTIDAMEATVTQTGDTVSPVNLLKLKDKATADAIVGRINLIAPEIKNTRGELILWQLDTLEDGMIVMKQLEYVVGEGFFTDGILRKDEYADWKYNSTFASSVTKIQATCPAELKFDFTGAAEGAQITVALPIELSGTGKLTFDVPEGKTVVVTGTISGTAGVRKSGKGTLIFSGTADNTFEGSLVVSEGTVRTTKAHGYSIHHDLDDGTVEHPEIDVHTGATLDIGNVCDLDDLAIISAGTITNSIHKTTDLKIGKIKTLTLKGDTTVCGHTFGMAKDSKIVLEGHKLTISMERGECVTVTRPDGTKEVHDHEFELNNTQVSGGKDNLATPDIIVHQGTLSCEGSTYVDGVFTRGVNHLGNAALLVEADGCLRLDADLVVKRIQLVNGNLDVTVPCNVKPDGTPDTPHTHTFKKVWEESLYPHADPTDDAHNQYFGRIIIRQELKGGITAPRIRLGDEADSVRALSDVGNDIYSSEIRRIELGAGEYIDCKQEFGISLGRVGSVFNVFFTDWSGENGTRRIFHGWTKFSEGFGLSDIINPFGVKFGEGGSYELTLADWYPWGYYAFNDDPVEVQNTLPLEDQDWAYAIPLWPYTAEFYFANTMLTTITTMDGKFIYDQATKQLNNDVLITTNGLLKTTCVRGDGKMSFVIDEKWLETYMGPDKYRPYVDEYGWAGGNGTISTWLNAIGENGIERWQSYMLGLDPTRADSLPVLAIRDKIPPSVQKGGKTFVNVKVGGIAPRGYQYISPVYQIEELDPATMTVLPKTVTPWQKSVNFQVEVPTKTDAQGRSTTDYSYLKYFRVNVSFQCSDGMN